jgi:hypothetical protein
MTFEIPGNLHPDCARVAWLLGRWGGRGHGDYPSIEPFQYGQELVFTHDGRAFFHYFARSWIVNEPGEKIRDDAQEAGFLRCLPGGGLELLLSHSFGVSEIWYGKAGDGTLELRTAGVSYTESAPEVTAGKRLYGNVEGRLLYAYDMAAAGQELQPHLWATLERQ